MMLILNVPMSPRIQVSEDLLICIIISVIIMIQ